MINILGLHVLFKPVVVWIGLADIDLNVWKLGPQQVALLGGMALLKIMCQCGCLLTHIWSSSAQCGK